MTKTEHLEHHLKTNHLLLKKLINEITEEQSLERGNANINHILWQTGHLLGSAVMGLSVLGQDSTLPDNYTALFQRGAAFSDDPSVYPPMSEIKEKLYNAHQKTCSCVSKLSDDELDREIEVVAGHKSTIMGMLLFLCNHEFYHAGQIAIIRKVLGLPRVFG